MISKLAPLGSSGGPRAGGAGEQVYSEAEHRENVNLSPAEFSPRQPPATRSLRTGGKKVRVRSL